MAEQKSFASTIKTIYFYFFAGVGLMLLIVGVFQLSNWGVKSFLLPRYNLDYEETRCDFLPVKLEAAATPSAEVPPGQTKAECEESLEEQREIRRVTDAAHAVTFIIVGAVVFVFHFRRTSLLNK